MIDNALISVIVPIYGVEDYLDKCIESIVNQTYRNIEIILVDDGSPDNCPKMVDDWATRDNRIVAVHKKNGGLSSARNAGIKVANGEYVAFIDSDDWIELTYIEMLYKAISKYNVDIGVVGYKRVYENKSTISSQNFIECDSITYVSPVEQAVKYFYENAICVWAKMYSRTIIGDIRFIENRLAEDIPFQTEILKKVDKVAFVNLNLYDYRQRAGSIARTIKPKYMLDYITSVSEAVIECKKIFPLEYDYCLNWLSSLLYEYCSTREFRSELPDSFNIIKHSLALCGGRKNLLNNLLFPESIIFYTYMQFNSYASEKELRKMQKDYRMVFPSKEFKKNKKAYLFKYLPAYFSLSLTSKLYKKFV